MPREGKSKDESEEWIAIDRSKKAPVAHVAKKPKADTAAKQVIASEETVASSKKNDSEDGWIEIDRSQKKANNYTKKRKQKLVLNSDETIVSDGFMGYKVDKKKNYIRDPDMDFAKPRDGTYTRKRQQAGRRKSKCRRARVLAR